MRKKSFRLNKLVFKLILALFISFIFLSLINSNDYVKEKSAAKVLSLFSCQVKDFLSCQSITAKILFKIKLVQLEQPDTTKNVSQDKYNLLRKSFLFILIWQKHVYSENKQDSDSLLS